MYRLYVDEVGTDDLANLEADNDRYLSLTGVAMKVDDARDQLEPKLNWIKSKIFEHDPDEPLNMHRRKIMQFKGAFQALRDEEKRRRFDRALLRIFTICDYTVITCLLDKRAMLKQVHWHQRHPYHYLMEILVEKYVQFLERKQSVGDIMPEGRKKPNDPLLQDAYVTVRENGTYHVSAQRMAARLPALNLKFRYKADNIAGLQLCDLIAHPSHMIIRQRLGHPVELGAFCDQVKTILLNHKYDRSGMGNIVGYGMKWLP
jgi:Protein of unknown function (DUF3800)